jgi:hypothetical protein
MGTATHIRPHVPVTNRIGWTPWIERHFNSDSAQLLGPQRVLAQVVQDTFGTKDIQDANTATHSWIAGQVGHMVLGGTAVVWLLLWESAIGGIWPIELPSWYDESLVAIPLLWVAFWAYKEWQDYRGTLNRAGTVFRFNKGDVGWSALTAFFYIAVGELLAVVAYFWGVWILLATAAVLWPVIRIAYWWLRRKLAIQQGGFPFFFRLSNFTAPIDKQDVDKINGLANVRNETENRARLLRRLFEVLFKDERPTLNEPAIRHLLICGPPQAGKTCLAVGIGNEFALTLQLGRYLTAVKLLDLLEAGPQALPPNGFPTMEEDGGRILWPWRWCDLVIIDDVYEGSGAVPAVNLEAAYAAGLLLTPTDFEQAILIRTGGFGLPWLGERRSVWVVSDPSQVNDWETVIRRLIGGKHELMTLTLNHIPPQPLEVAA